MTAHIHRTDPTTRCSLQVSPLSNGSMFQFSMEGRKAGTRGLRGNRNTSASSPVVVAPAYTTDAGAAVVVPASLPRDATFTVAVFDPVTKTTGPAFVVNKAEISWVQGSEGDFTQPGGWIRCFGRSLGFVPIGQIGLRTAPSVDDGAHTTTMRLTPTDPDGQGKTTVLTAAWQNMSSFQAYFAVPATLPPAEYAVAVSNGQGGYTQMDTFIHPTQPHVRTITVKPVPKPPQVFTLDQPHGINSTTQTLIDSTPLLKWGLAQAAALTNNGDVPVVLQLQRGWYALRGVVEVPDKVTIVGAGQSATMLMWQYQNISTAVPALLTNQKPAQPRGKVSWGLRDVGITANTYFHAVLNISRHTDGFKMQRVLIRANSYFCASFQGVKNVTGAHAVPWSENTNFYPNGQRVPPSVAIAANGRNWEITDSDVYSSAGVVSHNNDNNADANDTEMSAYGLLARNKFWNGKGAALGTDGGKQWIVEDNTVTGTSVMAGGNSLATGTTAFLHHLYWGRNKFQFDWGQDREIMTFDGGGIGYGGGVAAVSADGTNITSARLCHPTHVFNGGGLTILNGTGTGQVRRVNPSIATPWAP